MQYLRYVIHKEGIHTSDKKVQAVLDAPLPMDLGELRSFLGLVNYYGTFIRNFGAGCSIESVGLKTTRWNWISSCHQSFQSLKEAMTSAEVLRHYNP